MVDAAGRGSALRSLTASFSRTVFLGVVGLVLVSLFYGSCTAKVRANEFGVEQTKVGLTQGIRDRVYEPGLYFVPFGSTMHTFPREMHVLEATIEQQEARAKARTAEVQEKVDRYFDNRSRVLGKETLRVIDAINVQTSDGYAVTADITLLYTITNPVQIAKEFGWGTLYVDQFAVNQFRNSVLQTLGKMNAEQFYDEKERVQAVHEAEKLLTERFAARGFKVERLLLRNYRYQATYEKALHDKKVAVQLTVKNRKEGLVNEEKAKLQQIESKGNAAITISESEVAAQIAKVKAEADLYSAQTRAKGDKEVNIAVAEAKRLKADALTQAGGRYVVALETAKMFDNIEAAVMTPEQYIAFVRNAWALIGVSAGSTGAGSAAAPEGGKR